MPTILNGTFTLSQVMQMTSSANNGQFGNRFSFRTRDKIRRIQIYSINTYEGRGNKKFTKYQVLSSSTPKYMPYTKYRRGAKKRNITHEYQIIFETDQLSMNTKNWKVRLGTGRVWRDDPPQSLIDTIFRSNLKKWKKEKIAKHRAKKHTYLDVGDYNARAMGINADFIFRCSFIYKKYGHLYGHTFGLPNTTSPIHTNPEMVMFFPKHLINFFELLMNRGVLKNNTVIELPEEQ